MTVRRRHAGVTLTWPLSPETNQEIKNMRYREVRGNILTTRLLWTQRGKTRLLCFFSFLLLVFFCFFTKYSTKSMKQLPANKTDAWERKNSIIRYSLVLHYLTGQTLPTFAQTFILCQTVMFPQPQPITCDCCRDDTASLPDAEGLERVEVSWTNETTTNL